MLASTVLAAVVALGVVTAEVRAQTATTTTVTPPVTCRFPSEERDGGCVHRKEVEQALKATRWKRQLVTHNSACPRCVDGVTDVYPMWEDCRKLYYCYDSKTIVLDCRNFNATYFNPVTKSCETSAQFSNICINRSSPVLLE